MRYKVNSCSECSSDSYAGCLKGYELEYCPHIDSISEDEYWED